MCRFLLVRSKEKVYPKLYLERFCEVVEKSRTIDGDRQGDGWGIAWQEKGQWKEYKSLQPIWECEHIFMQFPDMNIFAVHARSASHSNTKGMLEYNEPFTGHDICYVFNGQLKGVKLGPVKGSIGVQKLFYLLQENLKKSDSKKALKQLHEKVMMHTRQVVGLNIGFIRGGKMYALCEYLINSEYFGLNFSDNTDISLICSEQIGNYNWNYIKKGQVIEL